MQQQAIIEIVNAVPLELYFLLWKALLVFYLALMVSNLIKNLVLFTRLRFSDIFSKRTLIIYDDFEGVIEEISLTGIFIRDKDGVTKFVPLNRWYMGDIKYPNTLDARKNRRKDDTKDETE